MGDVHFLNIEYLLLRVYNAVSGIPAVSGAYDEATAPAAHLLNSIATVLGSIALIGMFLTIALVVLLVWIQIKLLVVEHEGFEKKDELLHHAASVEHEAAGAGAHKNPRWERVHELASTPNEGDWRLAILEADIMLGDLLAAQGYRGEGVGEKLRDANPLQFSTLDLAWQAHKVRNDIAHAGEGFHLSQREANATIDLYRRVFEEFDFI